MEKTELSQPSLSRLFLVLAPLPNSLWVSALVAPSDTTVYDFFFLLIDFPESEKLTLFIANMWHDVFISQSVINKAMQLVARQRAKGEVLNCLRAFLNWEKVSPHHFLQGCSDHRKVKDG